MDPTFLSATQLAALTRARDLGCLELLDHYIARVERLNPRINAVVVRDFDRARTRALALDNQSDRTAPLFGVPMTIKESFDIEGLPTTWGSPAYRNSKATRNALAVDRMLNAGAVVFGKTNVPLMLADCQSYNDVYGTTNNPWNLALSPGGSSGGSAAALAAGLTGIEAGSDIGSSIRNPAHFCGVFGHKPTWGICPPLGQALNGNVAQADISVIGPLARSADDLAVALDAMAGPEDIDNGWKLDLPPPRATTLKGMRVAVMTEHKLSEVDAPISNKLTELADFLRREGATVSMTARPDFDLVRGHRLYIEMLRATTSARFDAAAMQRWRDRSGTPAAGGHQLLRDDGARQQHGAPRLPDRQRGAPPHAPSLGRVLSPLRRVPVPGRCQCRAAARSARRTLAAQHHRQRPSRAGDRSDVLVRHLVLLSFAGTSRRSGSRRKDCRSACRSSARNTPTAPRSSSRNCWKPRGKASCRRRDGSETHGPDVPVRHAASPRLVRKREVSALELLDHYIARIERLDPRINAVVVRDFDRARDRARHARRAARPRRAAVRRADDSEGKLRRRRPADDARPCRTARPPRGHVRRCRSADWKPRAPWCSARPTCRSISPIGKVTIRCTAPRRIRGMRRIRRADRRAVRRRRWPPGFAGMETRHRYRRLGSRAGALLRRVRP